ncbi:MAG: ROK family transcriptional regulator [Chloroflexi bacterium]|nr:ROK family transcriptional regulator [Chloroflexota bacterium]
MNKLASIAASWNGKSAHRKSLRRQNKSIILDVIRRDGRGISRAEIARVTALSRATVSTIVDELLAADLVREVGPAASQGGRPPTPLQLNADAGRVIGIDSGATHLIVALADLQAQILAEATAPFDIAASPEGCLDLIHEQVTAVLEKAACPWEEVVSIGMGVPGPVIAELGMVSGPPIMPGWDGFPIRERLRARWGKPVFVDNDADLGALGEWAYGAGQGETDMAYIKIGTGIGCGMVLHGELYRGVSGTAGEIGHVTISEDGPPCTCGNYGCLEAMAGGRAIAQRAQLAVKAGQRTRLNEITPVERISAQDVAEAAAAGDTVAQQLLADAGRHIGSALGSLINLINPKLVLIGGGVSQAGNLAVALAEAFRRLVEHGKETARRGVSAVPLS